MSFAPTHRCCTTELERVCAARSEAGDHGRRSRRGAPFRAGLLVDALHESRKEQNAALRRAEAASAAAWYQRLVVHTHTGPHLRHGRAPGADHRPASRSRGRRDYALEIVSSIIRVNILTSLWHNTINSP